MSITNGKFKKGDRVKLTADMAIVMMKGIAPHRQQGRLHMDWLDRRGTICRSYRYGGNYAVQWDDRKSMESWPAGALELAP